MIFLYSELSAFSLLRLYTLWTKSPFIMNIAPLRNLRYRRSTNSPISLFTSLDTTATSHQAITPEVRSLLAKDTI